MKSIMKVFLPFFILIVFLFSFFKTSAQEKISGPTMPSEKIRIVYFYAYDCPNCFKIKPFIERIKEQYKDKISFFEHDVKEKEEYRQLFYKFIEVYGVPDDKTKVPLIFVGNDYLLGVKDIEINFESKIKEKLAKTEPINFDCQKFLQDWKSNGNNTINSNSGTGICSLTNEDDSCSIGLPSGSGDNNKKQAISIGLIISTAVIDSINPCAIAVLLFLIAVLINLKSTRRRMLSVGLVYIFGVFISYYIAGAGIIKLTVYYNLVRQINIFAGIVVLISGILSAKEGLYPDSKQILVIPEKTKGIFMGLMQKGTFLTVFFAGILVSAFELPCTGQVYLAILSLMSQDSLKAQGYFYLLIYNLIFVLPLVLILIAAAWGLDIEKIQKLRKKSRGMVKVSIGAIMFILGVWLIYITLY